MFPDDEINLLFRQAIPANSNKKNILTKKIFFLCVLFMFGALFTFPIYNKSKTIEKNLKLTENIDFYDTKISNKEKAELRKLVKLLAKKENRHVNSIHAELRPRFNYRSYHHLDLRTYNKVKNYLTFRLKN